MKFTTTLFAAGAVIVSVYSAPVRRAVDPNLVPDFGITAGTNPTGTGDCDGTTGADGKPILVPCACPPERNSFIDHLSADVAAGHAVNNPSVAISFPTDDSVQSEIARITAVLISLQNLNGPGVGCPAASTDLLKKQKALQDGTATTDAAPAAPVSNADSSSDAAASGVDPSLVPDFGIEAGVNPSGTGDCDGITGPDGKPVLIPCSCPPERNSFIQHLSADVANGFAVNNPDVAINFPTDDSVESQIARIGAVVISLQNLNGPGVGCPAASTTLLAQSKALQDGTATAPAAPATAPTDANNGATAPATGGVDAALVPDFGITANTNPSGTGDCDGTIGPDGKPILIPCACPPERNSFIEHLSADVAAGHAVNNPDVAISFPTDDSVQGQIGRITAVLISLQNLNGPGKGCPAASTTLLATQKALQAQL